MISCPKHPGVYIEIRQSPQNFACPQCEEERGERIKGMFPPRCEPSEVRGGAVAAFVGPRAANDMPSLQEMMGHPVPPDWRSAVYDLYKCLERVKAGLNPLGPEVGWILARHLKIFEAVRAEQNDRS